MFFQRRHGRHQKGKVRVREEIMTEMNKRERGRERREDEGEVDVRDDTKEDRLTP